MAHVLDTPLQPAATSRDTAHQRFRHAAPARLGLALAAALVGMALAPSAQAQVLAFAKSGDGASIVLHEKAGPCMGRARFAEHITASGERTAGCWLKTSEKVLISFLDGERGDIPLVHLKQLAEI
jgi:hypothetical protein